VERLLLAAVLVAVAVVVAVLLQRRRPDTPTQPRGHVPDQLDRRDFDRPEAPWLVAVFTSATCETCAGVLEKAQVLASEQVVVQELEAVRDRDFHRRYGIDAVPLVVLADEDGVVVASFLGPVPAADLWAAVEAARREGGT
jgi:hypothetical protein